jgi:hypothetical protein
MATVRAVSACSECGQIVVKSTSRKFALFLRLGGEGKAHTRVKRCYRQLREV